MSGVPQGCWGPPERKAPGKLNDKAFGLALDLFARTLGRSGQPEVLGFRAHGAVSKFVENNFHGCSTTNRHAAMMRDLPPGLVNRLRKLGEALDTNQPVSVFEEGFVGLNEVNESEVNYDATGKRSSARPRSRRRASRRPWGRTSGQAGTFSSRAIEKAYGAGFRILVQQYEALAFEDSNGLWVAASSSPLGNCGPRVHFLVGFPLDRAILPRGWAFDTIGSNACPMAPKHTNFPDGSICAFTLTSGAWTHDDGLIGLLDHYSTWVIKKWHRAMFGWWPGPQVGACALYRRREFSANEWCGCESGKRYSNCHMAIDLLVNEQSASAEFRRLFACDYEQRVYPECILEAARTTWRRLPTLAYAFSFRRSTDEPIVS